MSEAATITSLKALFKFPFKGPAWQSRFIVGTALILASFLVPIVPAIFVSGYILKIMRQAIEREDLTLPAWDDWGRLAMDGLRVTLISLVYLLPGVIVSFGGMALYFASSLAFPLLMAVVEEGSNAALLLPLLFFASLAIMFLSLFAGSLLFVLGMIPLPMATAHFAAQDKVAAAFRVREWWPLLRTNKLGYFIAWVIVAGLAAILYLVLMLAYYTVVLCCFIPVLGAPIGLYLYLVSAALFGQTYRESAALLSASKSNE